MRLCNVFGLRAQRADATALVMVRLDRDACSGARPRVSDPIGIGDTSAWVEKTGYRSSPSSCFGRITRARSSPKRADLKPDRDFGVPD
jgi:hypothetical protein